MSGTGRALAVFDFDHTLIEGDSLWPFLVYAAGWPRALAALAEALFLLAAGRLRDKNNPVLSDGRTYVKAHLLRRLLARRKPGALGLAAERLYAWQKWNEAVRQKLLGHHEKGHRIVIASGGLDCYLPKLLKDLPAHDLLCTEMEIENGAFTGAMRGGNCVRARKAEKLAAYIAAEGPFEESWGYGNFPQDVPMLQLLKHQIVIS